MDAETPKAAELNLPQAFLLLATNDNDGKSVVPVYALRTTVAGAILAELDLIGAIGLQGKHVRATGTAPQTDFQHELELIRGKSRPHTPKRWVSMLEGRAEVQRVYEGMASLGIVEQAGEKRLGLFRTVRYPEKDHAPEAALLKKIQAALSGAPSDPGAPDAKVPDAGAPDAVKPGAGTPGATVPESKALDARTTALIALLHAAGLLGRLFPAADRSRSGELSKDYWPSRAVEDELRMIRLAEAEAATLGRCLKWLGGGVVRAARTPAAHRWPNAAARVSRRRRLDFRAGQEFGSRSWHSKRYDSWSLGSRL